MYDVTIFHPHSVGRLATLDPSAKSKNRWQSAPRAQVKSQARLTTRSDPSATDSMHSGAGRAPRPAQMGCIARTPIHTPASFCPRASMHDLPKPCRPFFRWPEIGMLSPDHRNPEIYCRGNAIWHAMKLRCPFFPPPPTTLPRQIRKGSGAAFSQNDSHVGKRAQAACRLLATSCDDNRSVFPKITGCQAPGNQGTNWRQQLPSATPRAKSEKHVAQGGLGLTNDAVTT